MVYVQRTEDERREFFPLKGATAELRARIETIERDARRHRADAANLAAESIRENELADKLFELASEYDLIVSLAADHAKVADQPEGS